MSGVSMLRFSKIDEKFIQIHQYYIMAVMISLISKIPSATTYKSIHN